VGLQSAWRRRGDSRLRGPARAQARADLAAGLSALLGGDPAGARPRFDAAHDRARSSARLHTAAHLGRLAAWLRSGDAAAARAELAPLIMAAPSAVVRQLAGTPADAPPAGSLWATWRARAVK
jgi:hypothetical protein